jgi:hypothetical protein
MARMHDDIHDFVSDYANSAWDLITPGTGPVELSPSEYFRFCHASYRVELVYMVLWYLYRVPRREEVYPWLFSKHAPWGERTARLRVPAPRSSV